MAVVRVSHEHWFKYAEEGTVALARGRTWCQEYNCYFCSVFSLSLSTSLLSSHKADALSRWIMQLCIFGSKVCQLLFVHKSASRLLSQEHREGSIQTDAKKSKAAWVGRGAHAQPSVTTEITVWALPFLRFTLLSEVLQGQNNNRKRIIKNNPNGDYCFRMWETVFL